MSCAILRIRSAPRQVARLYRQCTRPNSRPRKWAVASLAIVCMLANASAGFAASVTWTGVDDLTTWEDAANWTGGIPDSTSDVVFDSNGTTGGSIVLSANDFAKTLTFNGQDNQSNNYVLASGGGTLTLSNGTSPNVTVASGILASINVQLTGFSGLNVTGGGQLKLGSNSSDYTGGTTVGGTGTTVIVSNNSRLGALSGGVTLNNGTLDATAGFVSNRTFTIGGTGSSTIQVDSGTLDLSGGVLTGSGTLNVTGVVGSGLTLATNNSGFSGNVNVTGGATLTATDVGSLGPTPGVVTLSGNSTLASADNDYTTSGAVVLGSGGGQFSVPTGQLITRTGIISESSVGNGLTKIGNGSLTLSAAESYTGATTISAGVLKIGSTGSLQSTSISLVARVAR